VGLPLPEPLVGASRPAGGAPPTVEPDYRVSVGVVGGLLVELPGSRLGGSAAGEVRAWSALGRGSVTFGLRIGWEQYHLGCFVAAQPAGASCALPPGSSPGLLREQHLVVLSVPVTYRFLGDASRLNPYVGVLPQIIFEQDRVEVAGQRLKLQKTDLALSGLVGLEVLLHRRVAAFVEAGYRRVELECSGAGDTLQGLLALGGLRVGL
jgi:hypothetical protein